MSGDENLDYVQNVDDVDFMWIAIEIIALDVVF